MTPPSQPLLLNLVLDTNVVLDWLVFAEPAAARVGAAIRQGAVRWLVARRMVDEWQAVLSRPLVARWEEARERALTLDIETWGTRCVDPTPIVEPRLQCRDASDQVFIDLALAHAPSTLLTRDRALLALRRRALDAGVTIAVPQAWTTSPAIGLALPAVASPASPTAPASPLQ